MKAVLLFGSLLVSLTGFATPTLNPSAIHTSLCKEAYRNYPSTFQSIEDCKQGTRMDEAGGLYTIQFISCVALKNVKVSFDTKTWETAVSTTDAASSICSK